MSSGEYYIKNDYIYAPKSSGQFYISNGYIGPPEKAATTAGQQRWLIALL
jgi:hypothetical protein